MLMSGPYFADNYIFIKSQSQIHSKLKSLGVRDFSGLRLITTTKNFRPIEMGKILFEFCANKIIN